MNKRHKAFTIIEILIAMLILFTAIAFSNIAIKAFNNYQRQSVRYQDLYITALSLKEKMNFLTQFNALKYSGNLNGIEYTINILELTRQKNYEIGADGIGRNNGDFLITLYELEMILIKDSREKSYKFLLTKQKRIR
ncbi:MAG: Unknown protein [uncultured Sulfurovum sp.]|uniref:Prepilin-type N-terminal cleavage/methylation domain-containing protein n=1 Tax=uncultured Sulfurovum sp. TaxID=269237 RepID=A0A6S6TKQ5_9BACT|nr:MAG: Unknown protein [uncultured Sulfurovum sp.]